MVFNLGLLVLANWWAYKARNVETEYHESTYIAISMASVLQAWCMGIPILIMVWDNPQGRFFVATGIVFVTSLAVLGLIFIPKCIAIVQDQNFEAAEEKRQNYMRFAQRKSMRQDPSETDDNKISSEIKSDESEIAAAARSISISENCASRSSGGGGDVVPSLKNGGVLPGKNSSAIVTIHEVENNNDLTAWRRLVLTSGSGGAMPSGGAMKSSEAEPGMGGIKVLHNPRVSFHFNDWLRSWYRMTHSYSLNLFPTSLNVT
jgi:hypothetical protein